MPHLFKDKQYSFDLVVLDICKNVVSAHAVTALGTWEDTQRGDGEVGMEGITREVTAGVWDRSRLTFPVPVPRHSPSFLLPTHLL